MPNRPVTTLSPASSVLDTPRREPLIGLSDVARILRVIAHMGGMIFAGFMVSAISVVCVWVALDSPSGSAEASTGRDLTTGFSNVLDWLSNAIMVSGAAVIVLTLAGSIITRKINTGSLTAIVWPSRNSAYLPLAVETEGHYAGLYEDLVDTAVHSSDEDYQRLVGKLNPTELRNILKVLVDADARKWYDDEPITEASK